MISIVYALFHLVTVTMVQVRYMLWPLYSKVKKKGVYRLSPQIRVAYYHAGDIARILFCNHFLFPWKRSFEYKTFLEIEKVLPADAQHIIDVGANSGVFSLAIHQYLEQHNPDNDFRIHSFEPSASTFSLLSRNVALNHCHKCILQQTALSDQPGKAFLSMPPDTPKGYQDSFKALDLSQYHPPTTPNATNGEWVSVDTIDHYLAANKIDRVDLLKIDIEGAELNCLKGARQLLTSEKPPIIIFENVAEHCQRFGHTEGDVIGYLYQYGYQVTEITPPIWIAHPKK